MIIQCVAAFDFYPDYKFTAKAHNLVVSRACLLNRAREIMFILMAYSWLFQVRIFGGFEADRIFMKMLFYNTARRFF